MKAIVAERNEAGSFQDIFDFASRVNLRAVNKKSFESLAKAGAYDCFNDFQRRQYVEPDDDGSSLIEKSIRYANKLALEAQSQQASLFGGSANGDDVIKPRAGHMEPYGDIEKLNIEKELVGLYITGHPLDQYAFEMRFFTNSHLGALKELSAIKGREIRLAGVVSSVQHRMTKTGKPFAQLTLEDYNDSHQFFLFQDTYLKFKSFLETGWFLFIKGVVGNRWKSEELEFKINSIEYLGDIREKLVKGLELKVKTEDVDAAFIDSLEQIMTKHPGNGVLKINVAGQYENREITLDMISRKQTVDPSDELVKELEALDQVDYRVLL